MRLTKYKIGDLITVVDERNNIGIRDFYGININKEFMPTAANTEGLDESKYKLMRKGRFVYSGMQTGRDGCIRISMYNDEKPILVSPAYTTFEIIKQDKVIPLYFFMKFLSREMDRYGAFCSDGSIRSNLDWDVFCNIEIELPAIEIQQKYVDIYNSMIDNQKSYEQGLNDLKLLCDIYIEELRRKLPSEEIGKYIQECNYRNNNLTINNVQGVDSSSSFGNTRANLNGVDLSNYKIVKKGQFAYNPSRINLGSIALLNDDDCIISPMYIVFEVCDNQQLSPEYLMLWFMRTEFQRSTTFYASGSVRDTFDFNSMKEVKIPIPNIDVQNSISEVYIAYMKRKEINELLKNEIKDICPILVKGAIEEARKEA